jgi:hypothetical protein
VIALSPRDAAEYLSVSKRTLSRLHSIREDRRFVRPAFAFWSMWRKACYESLPLKADHAPIVFVHPITGIRHRVRKEM